MPIAGEDRPPMGVDRTAFVLLFLSLSCVGFNVSIFFSVMPPILRELGLPDIAFAWITALSSLLWAVASPYGGRLSDRLGAKPVILMGVAAWFFSSLFFGIAVQLGAAGILTGTMTLVLLVGARAVIAVSAGMQPAANAYVAERTSVYERAGAIAALTASFGLGSTIGPVVGAGLVAIGLAVPFYLMAGVIFLIGIGVLFLLKDDRQGVEWRHSDDHPPLRWLDKRFLVFLFISGASALAQAGILSIFAFYVMDTVGIEPVESATYVGLAMMVRAIAMMVTQLLLVRIFRPSPRAMLLLGAALTALAYAVLIIGGSYIVLLAGMALLGFAFGYLMPGTSAAASLAAEMHEQGAVAGLVASASGLVFMVGPFITLPLYHVARELPFILSIVVMLAVLAAVFLNRQIGRLPQGATGRTDFNHLS